MTRSPKFIIAALALALWSASTALACIPVGGIPPVCAAYWSADSVFVGLVNDISKAPPEPDQRFERLFLHFSVERPYRGIETTQVDVITITGTECDTKFQKGERWLVYARRSSATGRLNVGARTTLYSRADEDLSYIHKVSKGTAESAVLGAVFKYPYTPWEKIKIEVQGEGAKYRVFTDEEGRFKVPLVKPGRYSIRGTFPPKTGVASFREPSRVRESRKETVVEYTEDIQAGRCGYTEFLLLKY